MVCSFITAAPDPGLVQIRQTFRTDWHGLTFTVESGPAACLQQSTGPKGGVMDHITPPSMGTLSTTEARVNPPRVVFLVRLGRHG